MAQYFIWSTDSGWHLLLADADLVQYCCGCSPAHLDNLLARLQAVVPGPVLWQPPPDALLARSGIRQLLAAGDLPGLLLADREDVMSTAHAHLDAAVARGDGPSARLILARIRHLRGEFPGR